MSSQSYVVTDSTHIENMYLLFLKKALTVPFVENVQYDPDKTMGTLMVDLADNVANREDNPCPSVFLSVGETTYEEVAIDNAAQYISPEEAARVFDPDGKVNPVYYGSAKRTILMGSNPVTIETRIYGRPACAKFASRLAKVFYGFNKYLDKYSNMEQSSRVRLSKPMPAPGQPADAYRVDIMFAVSHICIEDLPEFKDITHQFFLTVQTTGELPLELTKIIDTKTP